ncbi:tRNA uridine-5-carboxymethylaminomethyl(34) synthesis GTPase MnmE [Lachnospiraceae bacterium OttesenSCG-928-D06]|nr:tRNA uridine-5-carboxymethylaminomethyl(34) synthesis GTPase MnmE [Lachnospiraceae bacterium OttesenSCG-928-D06]
MITDTIAAIATALTESGIGIIRISGSDAVTIADEIFRSKSGAKKLKNVNSHTFHYGFIIDNKKMENSEIKNSEIETKEIEIKEIETKEIETKEIETKEIEIKEEEIQENKNQTEWENYIIDEVMIVVMKAPKSYTTEDTVEINCHGGILVMRSILEKLIENGARLAEPGEFTKRAFLNGRIDLSKAEAVIDIINSKNEFALKSSVKHLKGAVLNEVEKIRAEVIYEIAFIESALDDPEHISLEGYNERLQVKIDKLIGEIQKLIDSADNGRIIKEGINTVIVGKPNVGKSSLLNIMVGEERAIVTNIAGTTRDILQESVNLSGIMLNVIDTAGIRNTEDVVEKIGVERAIQYTEDADLIIYVVDNSVLLDENDDKIISLIKERNENVIIMLNKTDLESKVNEEDLLARIDNRNEKNSKKKISFIKTSTKEHIGIDQLENAIKELFFSGDITQRDEVMITNVRHKTLLEEALKSLKMVNGSIHDNMPEDFYSIDLMSAYTSLGLIIGEETDEDLVNEIFSKFCMGK